MYVACKECIQGYDSDQLGPLQTYPHIFEKGAPVHMKTLKR